MAQGRYAVDLPTYGKQGETRIFHGVLRHNKQGKIGSGGNRIRTVLDAHPDAAVIFSASTSFQIRSVMQHLQDSPV